MKLIKEKILLTILLTTISKICFSQTEPNSYVIIKEFEISGNKKTRDATIIRELDFQIGDTILLNDLANRLNKNQQLLQNTNLFLRSHLNIGNWDTTQAYVSIIIDVKELWYIYPIPIFELADRNFNVWWKQYNRSIHRINYGLRLYYYNISGRRDYLKAVIQLGYTQKYELQYKLPFINKAKTIGINSNILFSRDKEVAVNTTDNDLVFYRNNDEYQLYRYRMTAGMTYRPALYQKHQLEMIYYHININDSIRLRNPNFFLNQQIKQRQLSISYRYDLDKRDFRSYPLNGYRFYSKISKEGLGLFKDRNSLAFVNSFSYFFQSRKRKKMSIALMTKGKIEAIRKQMPYYNYRAFGYKSTFVRGFEYYVVDGMDYLLIKKSLRYELINKLLNWKKSMPINALKKMPLRIYCSINSDIGYVNDPYYNQENPLANQLLWGGGIGLDFVFYIDKIIQIEYNTNQLGEKGLYLHYTLFL